MTAFTKHFRLGETWPDWWADAVTANVATTHNHDQRQVFGGPDYALIRSAGETLRAAKGDTIALLSNGEFRVCRPQPITDAADLMNAVTEFEATLPGWWWSVCVCNLTRDASCGPDIAGPDAALLEDRTFDEGFHCDDDEGTLASSLRNVMAQAIEAKRQGGYGQHPIARRE